MMAKVKIKLLHSSSKPGAEGEPGDVITCDSEIAEVFIAGKGADLIESAPVKETPRKTKRRTAGASE